MNVPRCCTDVKCTSAAKTAKELLSKMEQIQTQLHNEVILWKLRCVRGICSEESRRNLYELLQQFSVFNGMLDTVIECEMKFVNETRLKEGENGEASKAETLNGRDASSESRVERNDKTTHVQARKTRRSKEKAMEKRRIFFAKVQERNVSLLSVVLKEVEECRWITETTCTGHELSERFSVRLEETGMTSLCVLEESMEEQKPEGQQKETMVVLS